MPTLTPTYTETPTLTPTLTFTETSTSTPTATSTETPTATATTALDVTAETTAETHTPTLTPITEATGEVTPETTLEATSEVTPEVLPTLPFTPTPTTIPTAAPLPAEPPLELIYQNDFDPQDGDVNRDLYLAFWPVIPYGEDYALTINAADRWTQVTRYKRPDFVLQVNALLNTSSIQLRVRQADVLSASSGYRVTLHPTGQLELHREGQLFHAVTLPNFEPSVWHTLRVAAIGNLVRVTVDGSEWIVVTDSAPLAGGAATFSGDVGLLIDAIRLWQPDLRQQPAIAPVATPLTSARGVQGGGFASLQSGGVIGEGEIFVYSDTVQTTYLDAAGNSLYVSAADTGTHLALSPDQANPAQMLSQCGSEICVVNLDGSGKIQLTNDTFLDSFPTRSYNLSGEVWMAYQSSRPLSEDPSDPYATGIWMQQLALDLNGQIVGVVPDTERFVAFGLRPSWKNQYFIYYEGLQGGVYRIYYENTQGDEELVMGGIYTGKPDTLLYGGEVWLAYEKLVVGTDSLERIGIGVTQGATSNHWEFYEANGCTGSSSTLTIDYSQPTWSPDRSHLAFRERGVTQSSEGYCLGAPAVLYAVNTETTIPSGAISQPQKTFIVNPPAILDSLEWGYAPPVTASFVTNPDPPNGESPLMVTFTNTSEGLVYRQNWDFGNGVTCLDCNITETTQEYTNPGSYVARLELIGFGSTSQYEVEVVVNQSCPVEAEILDGTLDAAQYNSYLFDTATSAAIRKSCLNLFVNVMFLVTYHELGEGAEFYMMNELSSLVDIPFNDGINRLITTAEVQPFLGQAPTQNLYYLYGRVLLNGMADYAMGGEPIMSYFGVNFNSATSTLWGRTQLCDGVELVNVSTQRRPRNDACLDINWYDTIVEIGFPEDADVIARIRPGILAAIDDLTAGVADPLDGAYGARPANRLWQQALQQAEGLTNPGPLAGIHPTPFTFRTFLTQIFYLNWTDYVVGDVTISYPTKVWNGATVLASDLQDCFIPDETITQAYMRNLKMLTGNNTFTRLQAGESISIFDSIGSDPSRGLVRFGLTDDEFGWHVHVLIARRVIQGETPALTELSWQTFRFTRAKRPDESRGSVSRPITDTEFVPSSVLPLTCS